MNRIDTLFARLRSENRPALMPFLTAGDPDLDTTMDLIQALSDRGLADIFEIGIPYSDPIADGPVIAASYNRALLKGIHVNDILSSLKFKRSGSSPVNAPFVTMLSFAIVHRYGLDAYLDDAVASGVDGLIVPDLPVEESSTLLEKVTQRGMKLIQLITPTTPKERALAIARSTSGFIYYVSVAGITGERREIPPELQENVAWLRSQTDLPICIGFGISEPEHVRTLAPVADGLIVGSAIVRRVHSAAESGKSRSDLVEEVCSYVNSLKNSIPS
ncbi:MAG: Tryptophan synthase alpha chain [Planctomycetota bacterium]|jgi:tryptophan synthase alpha chain